MSTPTIPNGAAYMAATLYTGNGSTQTITNGVAGQSFQPDLVWVKGRSSASQDNLLVDSVRGISKRLISNKTAAETLESGYNITAFNSSGFTAVDDTNGSYNVNGSVGGTFSGAALYVGWQWKAGGTAVSNTSGTITSSVSANTTSGFSVVTYTGTGANATVGHGLGVTPKMVIVKGRSVSGYSWTIWNKPTVDANGAPAVLALESTSAWFNRATAFNSTAPTSSVFSIGTDLGTNTNGGTYVAYCWSEIAGYSVFGSYTGNGSATSGAFVYLGFRPRFVMIKRTDSTSSWIMIDSSRDPYNLAGQGLQANSSAAELTPASSGYPIDLLSNGFKLYETGDPNVSSGTYIYAAFAENPFKYANAR